MISKQINGENRRIAMLIDGDNAQASLTEKMLVETSKYGIATIRRIYGDWTASNMAGWKDVLQTYAIQPIQQFRYTTGKNATDSAMIIDAMDLLYAGGVDGFCLVSSDSDYTRLATRIREMGFFVMGIGKKTTPRAFVNACDVFVYTQNLVPQEAPKPAHQPQKRKPRTVKSNNGQMTEQPAAHQSSELPTSSQLSEPVSIMASQPDERVIDSSAQVSEVVEQPVSDPLPLLKSAFDVAVQDDGWAFLGTLGHHLRQLDPGFDSRTYGYKQLSTLIKAYPKHFSLREIKNPDGNSVISVKMKE